MIYADTKTIGINRADAQPRTEAIKARRSEFLSFALPDIGQEEIDAVVETLRSGWLTTGARTKEFERLFGEYVGARNAIAVNSCTAAMHLALEAIGLQPGDEVITTPYTFAATAEAVRYFDAKPVFVDVCPEDLNMNPALLEAAITERTRAVIPVHIAGQPAQLDTICEIAARHGLAVIEDAAHAFPCYYQSHMIGQDPEPLAGIDQSPQRMVCFSFYATKTITTGEGGMICTADDHLAERCRIMSLHGISKDAWKRYTAEGSWYYEIIAPGYKYNLTDLASAIGLAQLRKAERMACRRAQIAERYTSTFSIWPEFFTLPYERPDSRHAWHLYMLRLNLDCLSITRADFIEALKRMGIGTSVHFIPLHIHPYYREIYGYRPEDFPVAFHEYEREVSLPIYSAMTDAAVERTIRAVIEVAWANHVRGHGAVLLPGTFASVLDGGVAH